MTDIHLEDSVLVEYHNPKTGFSESRPGWLLSAPAHIVVIQEVIEGVGQYSYTVIPRRLVSRVVQTGIR